MATTDPQLEDYEATVSSLPSHTGDGYGYGGGVIVSIGPYAIPLGEGNYSHDLAEEIAARWNARRGIMMRTDRSEQPF